MIALSRALLLGVLLTACGAMSCARRADPRPVVAVRVETVTTADWQVASKYSGTVNARTQVELAFRAGGYVDAIASAPTPSASAREVTPAAVHLGGEAPVRGRKLPRGARAIQAGDRVTPDMVLASLRLSDFKHRVSELGGMGAESSAAFKKARTDLRRARTLQADGSISPAELEAVKARHDALAGSAGAAAARVGQASLALADAQLKSPLEGILLERRIEVGALVAPGAPAFVVADTSVVKVTFSVPDTVQKLLALGQEVTIDTEAFPDRSFPGAITKIAAQADARTRVFEIEATVDNAEALLKVGMVASIQLGRSEAEAAPVVVVPLSAIVRVPPNERGYWVYVVAEGPRGPEVHARAVELAHLVGNRVSVRSGLARGESVVVQGATLVREGQRVNVVPSSGGGSGR